MSEIIKTLIEMGFSESRAKLAVSKTSGNDIQEAMEWLLSHEEDFSSATTSTEQDSSSAGTLVSEQSPTADQNISQNADVPSESSNTQPAEAKSLKCDECGRLFKSQLEVEYHAAKSNHSSFSESTEEKKPLTEEEKKAQLAKVEEMMRKKRLEREEREKQEALEREKNRIKSGKEMLETKKRLEELEMKKLIEQRKREKHEEKLARQRVKEQIEQDRQARKLKFGGSESQQTNVSAAPIVNPITINKSTPATKDYTEAKLQIRLTNGSALTQTFGAKEPLSAVRLYVEMNRTDEPGPFSLMTTFPRKLFGPEDYEKPLDMLGLTPSAVIIVSKT